MSLLLVQAGVVEREGGPIREALGGPPGDRVEGLGGTHDPQGHGAENGPAGAERQDDAGLEAVLAEQLALVLPCRDAVDLLIGEAVQVLGAPGADHLRDGVGAVGVDGVLARSFTRRRRPRRCGPGRPFARSSPRA